MDDQRGIIEKDQPVVSNNHDQEGSECSSSWTMAVDQPVLHESEIVLRSNSSRKTEEGSIDHNKKAKGLLEGNVVGTKELKDKRVSSCAIDVKLNVNEDDGDGGSEMACRICQLTCDQSPERGVSSGHGKMKESSLVHLGCGCKDDDDEDDGDGGSEMACRICQLTSDQSPGRGVTSGHGKRRESSLVHLGCGCKDELGVAHSHCAETWFKLKGNRICEICGEPARNITGIIQEQILVEWNDRRSYASGEGYPPERSDRWWRGQPCCNFLMACLIVAFVLPWFFRVKIV